MKAVAHLTVTINLDAQTLRDAEKMLDDLLRPYEDDDRLISYEITEDEWWPQAWVQQ